MERLTIDPEHESKTHLVVGAAERQLGERRFGGAWIDRTAPSRPVIGVAAVGLATWGFETLLGLLD
jgi:hypothetical protein